jgi:DNA-binding PadR family transcriptional regulator
MSTRIIYTSLVSTQTVSTQTVLTPADLVILSVIAEQPRHGYDLKAELERREVRDWVSVSRPQVYYSLRKLAQRGLIVATAASADSGGPERQVYAAALEGQQQLALALGRDGWATSRPPQPFLIWLAMSAHTDRETRVRVLKARATFIEDTLAREAQTLMDLRKHDGPMVAAGIMMVELAIVQFECERDWLKRVRRRLLGSTRTIQVQPR